MRSPDFLIAVGIVADHPHPYPVTQGTLVWRKVVLGFHEQASRLILGIILGCALTVAVAYVSDATSASAAAGKPMVNWDVVDHNVASLNTWVREQWTWLTDRFRKTG